MAPTRQPLAGQTRRGADVDATTVPAAKPIELLIADGQPIALDAMVQVFDGPSFEVIAGCGSCEEALAVLKTHLPDVVIFDFNVPPDGLAFIHRHHPQMPVVLFTSAANDPRIHEALDLGVRGVVLKEMAPEALVQCVRKVHAGERWMSVSSRRLVERRRPRDADRRRRRANLTAPETHTAALVARGVGNRDIARGLGVTEGTLKIHLQKIYRKLDVDSRLALTLYVQGAGIL